MHVSLSSCAYLVRGKRSGQDRTIVEKKEVSQNHLQTTKIITTVFDDVKIHIDSQKIQTSNITDTSVASHGAETLYPTCTQLDWLRTK